MTAPNRFFDWRNPRHVVSLLMGTVLGVALGTGRWLLAGLMAVLAVVTLVVWDQKAKA